MLLNICIIERAQSTKLQKTVTAQTTIITIRLQLLVGIRKFNPEVREVAEVVKAVVVTATIKEKMHLTIYQPAKQTTLTSLTQETTVGIYTSTATK